MEWLGRPEHRGWFVGIPAAFVLAMTVSTLALRFHGSARSVLGGAGLLSVHGLNALLATAPVVVALGFTVEWWRGTRGARLAEVAEVTARARTG